MVDLPDKTNEGRAVKGIAALIRTQAGVTGRTYREMEQLAAKSGYKVRYQTVAELANEEPSGFPRHMDTVRGLAVALDVSEKTVLLAYAESLGLNMDQESSFVRQLPPSVNRLQPEISDRLIALIRSILGEGSGEHAGSTADKQAAGSAAPEFKSEVALAARRGTPDQAPDTDFEPA